MSPTSASWPRCTSIPMTGRFMRSTACSLTRGQNRMQCGYGSYLSQRTRSRGVNCNWEAGLRPRRTR
jgi:hypothetical protein